MLNQVLIEGIVSENSGIKGYGDGGGQLCNMRINCQSEWGGKTYDNPIPVVSFNPSMVKLMASTPVGALVMAGGKLRMSKDKKFLSGVELSVFIPEAAALENSSWVSPEDDCHF